MSIIKNYRQWKMKRVFRFSGMFNAEWFNTHQDRIIYLLNHRLLKYYFRIVLKVPQGIKFSWRITEIFIHKIRCNIKGNTYKQFSYSGDYFRWEMYRAFKWVWWTLHFIDYVLLDRYKLFPGFGFDTLTAYPDANPGTDTCDGWISYTAGTYDYATFSEVRDELVGKTVDLDDASKNVGTVYTDTYSDNWKYIIRGFFSFDTDISGGEISAAAFKITFAYQYTQLEPTNVGEDYLSLVQGTQASANTLVVADYSEVSDTIIDSVAPGGSGVQRTFTISSSYINTSGISKFSTRLKADVLDSAPVWESLQLLGQQAHFADNATASNRPYVEITYTVASAGGNNNQMVV